MANQSDTQTKVRGRPTTRVAQSRNEIRASKISATKTISAINKLLGANYEGASANQISAARLKVDGYFKLLNKVLPDLKSIEMDAKVTATPHEEWLKDLQD